MSATTPTHSPTLESLSTGDRRDFVERLAGVFEHSPWIAERAWESRPFPTLDALHHAMLSALQQADREAQLALIRAHPELAGKEADEGKLTRESTGEQTGAGLDRCTPEERSLLREFNARYREKFGFPFVMAVKGRTRSEIMTAMRSRLNNDRETEFDTCIREIGEIARFRLDTLLQG